jgi:hypothetical protein
MLFFFVQAHVAEALKLLRSALLGEVEQERPQASEESDSDDSDDDDGGGATKRTPPRTPAKGTLIALYGRLLALAHACCIKRWFCSKNSQEDAEVGCSRTHAYAIHAIQPCGCFTSGRHF